MKYPPFLSFTNEIEYKDHFETLYCKFPIQTFDGIMVRFRKRDFDHAFFETIASKDDTFSFKRAQRMEWMKIALQDPNKSIYCGWDNKKKRYTNKRRVTIVMGNFVVIISIHKNGMNASFVTAFVADTEKDGKSSTIEKIKRGDKWEK